MHSAEADLTTRARIRNAAIELIAAHGYEHATMRRIAEAAHVSPALVVHHFGDKEHLRAECDAHVVALVTTDDITDSPSISAIQALMADLDSYGPALDYLARMLTSGTPAAADLFDQVLAGTEQMLAHQQETSLVGHLDDPRATALLLTVFGLAPLLLGSHVARALSESSPSESGPSRSGTPGAPEPALPGPHSLSPAVLTRITMPTLELFTHGLYRDDSLLRATAEALGESPQPAQHPDRTHKEQP